MPSPSRACTTYAAGRAQRAALVERLSTAGGGARAALRPPSALQRRRPAAAPHAARPRDRAEARRDGTRPHPGRVLRLRARPSWRACGWSPPRSSPPSSARSPRCSALWAANAFLNWQRSSRTEEFINQLPELSRILANATQAGLALRTALGMAAEELEAPGRRGTAPGSPNQLALGRSIDDALGELAERLPSRELVVLVTTLVLSNRAGGTVVGSLRNLTETLEERKETRREVRTMLVPGQRDGLHRPGAGPRRAAADELDDARRPGPGDRLAPSDRSPIVVAVGLLRGRLLRHPPHSARSRSEGRSPKQMLPLLLAAAVGLAVYGAIAGIRMYRAEPSCPATWPSPWRSAPPAPPPADSAVDRLGMRYAPARAAADGPAGGRQEAPQDRPWRATRAV